MQRDPTRDAPIFVRRLHALGTRKISLSGGEALLDPAFERAVHEGRRLGLDMILTTNGDPLRHRIPDAVRSLQYVKLSFYGHAATHDMAMNAGNYQYLLHLCARLRGIGVTVGANYMLTDRSREDLLLFLDDAARAGINNVLLQTYMPVGHQRVDERWRWTRSKAWAQEVAAIVSNRVNAFPGGIKIHDCAKLDFFIVMTPHGRLTLPRYSGADPFNMGSLFDDRLSLPDGRQLTTAAALEIIWGTRESTQAILPIEKRSVCQIDS